MKKMWIALLASVCMLVSACGSYGDTGGEGTAKSANPAAQDKPVEKDAAKAVDNVVLTMTTYGTGLTPEDFNLLVSEPLKKQYSNITVNFIEPGKGKQLEDLITAGEVPDLLVTWNGGVASLFEMGLLSDLTPLMKKENVDINRFDPVIVDVARQMPGNKGLLALPYDINFNGLYYNKDIFDKFGVGFPQDGLTWEQAIELSKKVSRVDGSDIFRGLDPDGIYRLALQRSIDTIDAVNNKASMINDQWKWTFETSKTMFTVANNMPFNDPDKVTTFTRPEFFKGNIAMMASVNLLSALIEPTKNGLNWDVAQYPSFKEKPNVYGMVDAHLVGISKTSKHPDEAMKVIGLMTSDDVQMKAAKQNGRLTSLKDEKIRNALASEMDVAKGKHIASVLKSHPAPAVPISELTVQGRQIMHKHFTDYVKGSVDVNTALRQADEEINQLIASQGKK